MSESDPDPEEPLLRSVALQNARSILQARERAEDELVETREALRLSQERLTAALAASHIGTFRLDFATNTAEWDANIGPLFGVPAAPGVHVFGELMHLLHPDDRPVVQAKFRVCRTEGAPFDMEFRVIWPDASVRWLAMGASVVRNAEGVPTYLTGACRDVTRLKTVEEALRDETRTLEVLNETGKLLAGQLDLERLVQAVTDAATAVSGAKVGAFFHNVTDDDGDAYLLYSLSGAPREAFERFDQARAAALFEPTFGGAPPIRIHDLVTDPRYGSMAATNGLPPELSVRSYLAVPVRSRSGDVIGGLFFGHPSTGAFTERSERLVLGVAAQAGIAIDNARLYDQAHRAATERKALLDSERAARAEAERMSEAKDDFLAMLSHELRTPLNAILGWAQVLRTVGRSPDEMRAGLETIERNARVQTQLIDDLLDMSRITSGKLRFDMQPLHPISFIEAAIETVEPAARAKGIRIERALDPAAGPLSGDPGRLQQVVWNLLSNAIKFTPRAGRVQVVLERLNSHLAISIADTGIGIQADLLPHLFERFRQGDATTTRKYGGLGLGLSLVKSLVELHGGTVRVESPGAGQGTTVTVTLPLAVVRRDGRPHEPTTAEPAWPARPRASELAGLKVLVVDDQPDARDLIERILVDCDAAVVTASSAEEALTLVEAERPDVLVSDIGMPETDGYELLRRVRALGADRGGKVPAIALTAFARSEDRTRTLRAGFLVHVSKPVDASELVATIASVAGRVDDEA